MLPTEIIERYRVRKGDGFRLADFDPDDTCGLDMDKGDAKQMLDAGVQRLCSLAGKALCRQSLGDPRRPARYRHRRQGRRHQAGDVRRQSARLRGPFLQGAKRAGARSRLPVARFDGVAGARADRYLQSLLLRGDDRRAGASRAPARNSGCRKSSLPTTSGISASPTSTISSPISPITASCRSSSS